MSETMFAALLVLASLLAPGVLLLVHLLFTICFFFSKKLRRNINEFYA